MLPVPATQNRVTHLGCPAPKGLGTRRHDVGASLTLGLQAAPQPRAQPRTVHPGGIPAPAAHLPFRVDSAGSRGLRVVGTPRPVALKGPVLPGLQEAWKTPEAPETQARAGCGGRATGRPALLGFWARGLEGRALVAESSLGFPSLLSGGTGLLVLFTFLVRRLRLRRVKSPQRHTAVSAGTRPHTRFGQNLGHVCLLAVEGTPASLCAGPGFSNQLGKWVCWLIPPEESHMLRKRHCRQSLTEAGAGAPCLRAAQGYKQSG